MTKLQVLPLVLATEPQKPSQWYYDNTYYQILVVEPNPGGKQQRKYLKTTLVTKTKKDFEKCVLDKSTKDKLKDYPKSPSVNPDTTKETAGKAGLIASYLPSSGVVFEDGFINALFPRDPKVSPHHIAEVNNFYDVYRTLLHSRKISQLIAKTWHHKLQAKSAVKGSNWDNFTKGEWKDIQLDTLDGLIAREIFLLGSASEVTIPKGDSAQYEVLSNSGKPAEEARFLILPSSKSWQCLALSLLLSGQVYYKVHDGKTEAEAKKAKIAKIEAEAVAEAEAKKAKIKAEAEAEYHQVAQPILSTGEIVAKYALDVAVDKYKGDIKELDLKPNKPSAAYLAVMPYPPIPSVDNVMLEEIKDWAYAKDVGGKFPFYIQDKDEQYLIGVKNHTAPNPYIPLSCT